MNLLQHYQHAQLTHQTRRLFLRNGMAGLGAFWLAGQSASATSTIGADQAERDPAHPFALRKPHFVPRAKRVIVLHMAGAPSQLELFDHKPELTKHDGQDCPQEFLEGQRFAFIRGVPKLLGSYYPFHQTGESGQWISDRLPNFERVIDRVTFIRSMTTDQFNHAPAQLLLHTGNQNLGYASMGSWLGYGLGSENQNLPGFVVLVSGGRVPSAGKSAWGAGFLPSVYQGVQCQSVGEPVLFLSNPKGIDTSMRNRMLTAINQVNQDTYQEFGDPETLTRINQYEMAANMQLSATEAMNLKDEPQHIHQFYGTQPGKESFANNCVLARRLAERGVRFIQLFHWGWDSHGASPNEALDSGFKQRCQEVDQPMCALLTDLEQRGLLEDTLVVFAGEFGRTPMRENRGGREMKLVGRDHNPNAFTIWMAGGGVKQGFSYGETDPIGYKVAKDPVQIRDLHATIWRLLGIDHERLVYPHQGLHQKLTGVKPARVVDDIIA